MRVEVVPTNRRKSSLDLLRRQLALYVMLVGRPARDDRVSGRHRRGGNASARRRGLWRVASMAYEPYAIATTRMALSRGTRIEATV